MSFISKVYVGTPESFLHILEREVVIIYNSGCIPKGTSPPWVNASLLRM